MARNSKDRFWVCATVDGTKKILYKLSYPSMDFLDWYDGKWEDANDRQWRIIHDPDMPEVDLATATNLMKTLGKPLN